MALEDIQSEVEAACSASGRSQNPPSLIAVSKKQPLERVTSVLEQGHRIFGENRIQEAAEKWPEYRKKYGEIELHLLGPLQTNKARQAMQLFDVIHSLDRIKLARSLARLKDELGNCPDLFIQVNTGEEPQKSGILPKELPGFVDECRSLDLPIIGLMCIPPIEETPALHFALLKKLAERHDLTQLSMGMSADFKTAIAFGATHIRVGSAIFGARPNPA